MFPPLNFSRSFACIHFQDAESNEAQSGELSMGWPGRFFAPKSAYSRLEGPAMKPPHRLARATWRRCVQFPHVTFLPIFRRELAIAARRTATYRQRLIFGGLAAAVVV